VNALEPNNKSNFPSMSKDKKENYMQNLQIYE